MATLITGKDLAVKTEVCPNCMDFVKTFARLTILHRWILLKSCYCNYISTGVKWPFNEEATLSAVKPGEFATHGILLHG